MSTEIFLATPCYGGQAHIHFMRSVLALQSACLARGVGLTIELGGGDALISRARAAMAAKFLQSRATHLLFVDADIGFTPEGVFRLLDADRDLIGGICPLKRIDWEKARRAALAGVSDLMAASIGYVVRFLPSANNSVSVDDDGIGEVAYVGTGFMMVKRGVVERVAAAYPELRARLSDVAGGGPGEVAMVFEPMIERETGEHLSEDYAFCRRWRDLGGRIHADFHSRLTHVGHAAYAGSVIDALARAPAPAAG